MAKGKQVRRKIQNMDFISLYGKETGSGAEACFFRMSPNSKYGIKAYEEIEEAITAWKLQKKAAKMGLAPEVGKILIIRYYNNKRKKNYDILFGYETKIAKKVVNGYRNPIWKKQSDQVEKQLIQIGLGSDFCPTNCGIIKNKLVSIDFGVCSQYKSKDFL